MASDNPNPATGEVDLFDPAFTACPHRIFSRLRAGIPVARGIGLGGGSAGTVVLSRYEDVTRALQDCEYLSSDIGLAGAMSPAPVHVDPPEHARFRELLKPWFSGEHVRRLEPFVRSEVDRLIDSFVAREACDYQWAFAVPLPGSVILRIMGLPFADLDLLLAIKDEIIHPDAGSATAAAIRRHGVARASAYFEKAIDERVSLPADDLLTDLVKASVDAPERFTRLDILRVCLNLVLGGLDTVTASLGCAMAYLARNPGQRRRLIESRPVVARAVRELMRMEAPVMFVPRRAKRDLTIAGVEIRAGTLVMLLLGSANADESVFPAAERVDFERHPNPHVAFGLGRHRCVGERLAQMVIEVALEGWHRRIPDYVVGPDEALVYSAVVRSPERLPLEWNARALASEGAG